jgi:hypothetical protein
MTTPWWETPACSPATARQPRQRAARAKDAEHKARIRHLASRRLVQSHALRRRSRRPRPLRRYGARDAPLGAHSMAVSPDRDGGRRPRIPRRDVRLPAPAGGPHPVPLARRESHPCVGGCNHRATSDLTNHASSSLARCHCRAACDVDRPPARSLTNGRRGRSRRCWLRGSALHRWPRLCDRGCPRQGHEPPSIGAGCGFRWSAVAP